MIHCVFSLKKIQTIQMLISPMVRMSDGYFNYFKLLWNILLHILKLTFVLDYF